jgi:DNA (cytosine-5)-methyltransferase 1
MRGSLKKPVYQLPSMEDIKKVEPNGYKVVSTFSGCGGSSLGYKLAGYKVIWANEFIPRAAEVYKLNHNGTPINSNDIRNIKPEDILKETGLKKGELDLLDGSPPCATFSMSGKREQHWNKVKKYSDTKQRTDDLFLEYIRILRKEDCHLINLIRLFLIQFLLKYLLV